MTGAFTESITEHATLRDTLRKLISGELRVSEAEVEVA